MQIREEHLYHGAALNQIAEHRQFTAINALEVNGMTSRSTFKINNGIAIFLKYCTKPKGTYKEYQFTINKSQLKELTDIDAVGDDLQLALICVKACHICCISYKTLVGLIAARERDAGYLEDQYQVLVTLGAGEAYRIYMNKPGRRKIMLGKAKKVARNRFPNALFK